MKVIKYIVYTILVLIILFLVGYMLLPKKMHVETDKDIPAAPDKVYAVLNNPHNMQKWSTWAKMDPNMKITYFGPESGAGAGYSWEGNKKVGKGKLTIIESSPDKIVTDLDFGPMGVAKATMLITKAEKEKTTNVKWMMDSDGSNIKMPWKLMSPYMNIFMKGAVKKDFQVGLDSLAQNVDHIEIESTMPTTNNVYDPGLDNLTVEIDSMQIETAIIKLQGTFDPPLAVTVPQRFLLSERDTATWDVMGNTLEQAYGRINTAASGATRVGKPMAFFYKLDDAKCVFEPAMAFTTQATTASRVRSWTLPQHQAVKCVYHGPYSGMRSAYMAVNSYAHAHHLLPTGNSFYEIFTTDRSTQADSMQWVTEIYLPVHN